MASFLKQSPSTPENWTLNKLTEMLGDNRRAADLARRVNNLLQFTPAGIPQGAYEAGKMIGGGVQNRSIPQAGLGLGMAALGMVPMARGAAKEAEKVGIKAYHGSPHLFDKFDASKIGTGEGAQVYGHGLYFAEHPDTAQAYRDALEAKFATYDGGKADPSNPAHVATAALQFTKGDKDKAISYLHDKAIESDYGLNTSAANMIMSGEPLANRQSSGHMYEVNINAHPDHFLDWDKPLSEQPQHIQDFAKSIPVPNDPKRSYVAMKDWQQGGNMGYTVTGSTLHSVMSDYGMDPAAQRALTQRMQDAGIPGIKYLDQGSRTAGNGTRNYVVFDPNTVQIMKRYAIPAAVGTGAAAAAISQQPGQSDQTPQY